MSQGNESVAWQALEAAVERAAVRLEDLRRENVELRRRADELERALAGRGVAVEETAARWQEERAEVARRVDDLVDRLESLLASSAEAAD